MTIQDIDPRDVARMLAEHSIVLIDVREPQEYAAERIPGALLFPLSSFDPAALPEHENRDIVFHCGSGIRSAKAVSACATAGLVCDRHMRGGIQAWKAAGLPTIAGS